MQNQTDNLGAQATANTADGNLDEREVARFARLAREWWDPKGKFAPLHALALPRMTFVRRVADALLGTDPRALKPLKGLAILDVGCGGGLASEPLARLGGTVTGIDPGEETIGIAQAHAAQSGLEINYRVATAEQLVSEGAKFDLVVCLEVLEHVPDPAALVATLAALVRPGGGLVLSTLNRTQKAYALAIVGAEYVLGWLERGTHDWDRFITPDELSDHLAAAGLEVSDEAGVTYNVVRGTWSLSDDMDVNYMMAARKPQPLPIAHHPK